MPNLPEDVMAFKSSLGNLVANVARADRRKPATASRECFHGGTVASAGGIYDALMEMVRNAAKNVTLTEQVYCAEIVKTECSSARYNQERVDHYLQIALEAAKPWAKPETGSPASGSFVLRNNIR